MSSIKNVVLAGATGSLGSVVAKQVIASGHFNVTLLKRIGSSSVYPEGVKIIEVDYTSVESLQKALAGQDAVVSMLATETIEAQIPLIDAAAAAGIKRFLPSEFGSKLDHPNTRKIPIFGAKVKIEEYLESKAASTGMTYTFVYNNAFSDWGLQHRFLLDLTSEHPTLINGGDLPFSTTSLSTVGDAVVGILLHPEETKNRPVQIQDVVVTQNKLLALARQAYPERKWEPVSASLDEMYAQAEANLAKGDFGMGTIVPFLYRSIMDPAYGGRFDKLDNELLGLKTKGDDFIIETIKAILQ